MLKSKNSLKVFSLNLIVFVLLAITVDKILGQFLKYLYFNQVAGANYSTTYAIDSTRADILICGSSRANHHYVPEIFEQNLKLSFYNAGRDGNSLFYSYAIIKAVLVRYKPKLIILDLTPDELFYQKQSYDRLSSLLPYYYSHPEIRSIVDQKGSIERIKLQSALYTYNSQLVNIIAGNLEISKTVYYSKKGYMPLHLKMKNSKSDNNLLIDNGTIDKNKINALNEIGIYCQKNKIKLVFAYSPIFSNSKESLGSEIIENIAKSQKCKYFDFSNDSIFDNHPEYFQDNVHLNDNGAKVYSQIISEKINEYEDISN